MIINPLYVLHKEFYFPSIEEILPQIEAATPDISARLGLFPPLTRRVSPFLTNPVKEGYISTKVVLLS